MASRSALSRSAQPTVVDLRGRPLEGWVRERLERALGADLGEVRVYRDDRSNEIASTFGADAVTAGTDIFLAHGKGDPSTEPGLRLLAHEVAHVVQQARLRPATWLDGDLPPGCETWVLEAEADEAAERALRGLPAPSGTSRITPSPLAAGTPLLVQRHASWEHRLLGDQSTADLVAIAMKAANRPQILTKILNFLGMWKNDPDSVTPAMINASYPYIRTLRLATSGLLVTYGELNTLPDYMPNPMVLDAQPRSIMLPILQAVRQEGYNWVNWLLGNYLPTNFAGAVSFPLNNSMIDLLAETKAIDALTANIGPARTNHYTALVSRNACHFAPYSWYRWQQFHLIARDLATQAHAATDAGRKAWLAGTAWRNHGYADHFLQDSFAAGHLVNKNLVMQWFVEWAAGQWYVPVADWDRVKQITTTTQPGLAAWQLYNLAAPGGVRDPQTAEEQVTTLARMTMAGVQAQSNGVTQAAAYLNYLAFLNSTVVQSASGVLHDFFNKNSLWVGSAAHPTPYQLYGDDTMLNGGDGVGIASATAHLSQQALLDLLASGSTSITMQSIMDNFPSTVKTPNGIVSLQAWNQGLRGQANDLFPDVHYFVLRAFPSIGDVSVDVSGGWVWQATPGSASAIAAGADGSVWSLATAHVNGGHMVQKWNGTGWVTQTGSAVRIAVDAAGWPWVVNDSGTIFHLTSAGWQQIAGAASDIACGPDGSVWCLGVASVPGGHPVLRWNGTGWAPMTGGAVRIAIGADGLPWAVNDAGNLFRMNADATTWTGLPGDGTAIGIGANGEGVPWLITKSAIAGGYTIASWSNGAWVPVEGGAVAVAVDATNSPWLVNSAGTVYRRVVKTSSGAAAAAATPAAATPAAAAAAPVPDGTLDLDDSGRRVLAIPPSAESVANT